MENLKLTAKLLKIFFNEILDKFYITFLKIIFKFFIKVLIKDRRSSKLKLKKNLHKKIFTSIIMC